MKTFSTIGITITALIFGVFLFNPTFLGARPASACGWGNSGSSCGWGNSAAGGSGYVPQPRQPVGPLANAPSLTDEQVHSIIDNHIKKLNPGLKIGQIRDNGGFYEAEILDQNNTVVEHLGVDKQTGRLMVIR
jgi:hypothetical protein